MSYNSKENEDRQARELLSFHRNGGISRVNDVSSDQVEVWVGNADHSVCKGVFLKSALMKAKKKFQAECDARYRNIFIHGKK